MCDVIGQLLIVRAPKVFGVVWTLLSPFIDDNTQKKFMIYTGDDHEREGGLLEYIPKEYVPKFLNGPAECVIPKVRGTTSYFSPHIGGPCY